MQLLVRNSDVKESLIQTEVIVMQSPLRDRIITGNLLRKYHEPVPISKNRKWSNVPCYPARAGVAPCTDSRQWTITAYMLQVSFTWSSYYTPAMTMPSASSRWASRRTHVNRLPAVILCWPNYLLVKYFMFLFSSISVNDENFWWWIIPELR